ncbi:hypothetical protein AT3G11405 [Arabidopsis thaliana]|uniref:DUF7722 domain-containing protein n=1 Tax=Arabidopsis thaliana TaxID=3702 RepID=Q58FW2_ARATH|nr:uncharacterized protein AT3G11405 [Arabidopsis thaliana]AAX55173.1 hypothetical protein At3g11405 [Arabidopsis thaliana]AEE75043.1 hypothetical protein AT3G11405 [Arabidopsis thaliana]|eukprot:NP_974283.1 hypothetical protein AT3G11405 [Arabidopsis thaliana]
MEKVSKLSIIFRDELQNFNNDYVENIDVVGKKTSNSSSDNESDQFASLFGSSSPSSFQMPLQYPNYAKEQYDIMSEEELDRLLKLYGLPTDIGNLSCKKEFAVGAFLWETGLNSSLDEHDSVNPNSSIDDLEERSLIGLVTVLVKDMVQFIFRG